MSTGWTIQAGYQYDVMKSKVATELVRAVAGLTPEAVAKRSGVDLDFVRAYLDPKGCAVTVRVDADEPFVTLMASGGDPERTKKERCARAICMIVMEDLNELGFNISVICS